ncbi:UV radiation resistance protein and autophagy-related subunit 14-domain-containing protein [Cantharellus anzutake]|uniref:UV radiation resistance protein and autophagy-related subunit 14-domain-containing protein n=1 Tax=Cantharellus anzutake TaxID=1750568 RepID=UPI0019081BE1|nr:UV radiation resistance protein and autophagy-related subunit 14-domain-containing protein [Cantharellus anzutake]KAF8336257.1 UV radiation resistance protein and autophagy-related subunit 14-domain-containing protein [Cantharellus anzutake]
MSAICASCQAHQRKFYCVDCLRSHIHRIRNATQLAENERDVQIDKAKQSLSLIDQRRIMCAKVSRLEDATSEAKRWTQELRGDIDDVRSRVIRKRDQLRRRRINLEAAREISEKTLGKPPYLAGKADRIQNLKKSLSHAHAALARSRRVLIRELIQVFDIGEYQPPQISSKPASMNTQAAAQFGVASVLGSFGRRTRLSLQSSPLSQSFHPSSKPSVLTALAAPSSSPATTRSSTPYAIASLPFPSDLVESQRLPAEHIQATIQHLLHFIQLLAFYLGVKLPFYIIWDGGIEGVGRPWIQATKGDDDGGWAKFTGPHPLFSAVPSSPSQSPTSSAIQTDHFPVPPIVLAQHSSTLTSSKLPPSFTTGLAMLHYNIAYLLFTQRLPSSLTFGLPPAIGLTSHKSLPNRGDANANTVTDIQAAVQPSPTPPDALRNLVSMCFSPLESVGLYSHSALRPPYRLGPPTTPHTVKAKSTHYPAGTNPQPVSSDVQHAGTVGSKGEREPFRVDFGDVLRLMHGFVGTSDGLSAASRNKKRGKFAEENGWDLVDIEEGEEGRDKQT